MEFMSDFLQADPGFILGANPAATAGQLAKIFGEGFQDKYLAEDTKQREKMAWSVQYLMNSAPSPVPEAFKNTCQNVLSVDAQKRIEAAYTYHP